MRNIEELQASYNHWVDEFLGGGTEAREGKWTETIAVGSKGFVEATAEPLRIRGNGARCQCKTAYTNFGSQPFLTIVVLTLKMRL